ncbi:hypothetical protein JTB14_029448 [Gonioctena quinquepunctata]|nr:hypothetical protein JTB14_029448 [Gonioctena quinquepunctata]
MSETSKLSNLESPTCSEREECRAYKTPNFIRQNIRKASLTRKIEYDKDDDEYAYSASRSSSDRSRKSQSYFKTNEHQTVDLESPDIIGEVEKNMRMSSPLYTFPTNLRIQGTKRDSTRQSVNETKHANHFIKQTTCPACMEKWKKPLPIPRTPKVKRSSVVPTIDDHLVKTDSKIRIDKLILREKYTLETYDKKFTSANGRRSSVKKDLSSDASDIVLSRLEMARIRQEERERETQKKLEKFLKSQ